MSEYTPSQAEGEPEEDAAETGQPPPTTPSQAEGPDTAEQDDGDRNEAEGGE
ncbi:hypothetical protein ABZ079_15610 [Streptomyces sp. NPDC006314]|uniref:hypothetical protein n=1 Tax=Streptomyces sp. NPDC006314 TaxID=3154475 RepID=UPI0033B368D5